MELLISLLNINTLTDCLRRQRPCSESLIAVREFHNLRKQKSVRKCKESGTASGVEGEGVVGTFYTFAFLPLHLWKPPDAGWLTKKVRSKEYGSIFDHDHESRGSVKCNCKEHGFWRNTEPLGLYQFRLTLSEPQSPMWTNLMIIATFRVIMESKLNEILYTRYSKHWIQCLADTQLIVVTSIHYHHHILQKKIDDMLDIYLRIPIADPHASCVPWVNCFKFSVPIF